MALRATNVIPSEKYTRAKQLAVQLKRLADSRAALFNNGGTADEILATADNLNALKAALQEATAIPGIVAYAQEQEDDPTYAVGVEFNATITAVDAVVTEIVTTLPADGNGWLLIHSINPDGSLSPRTFTKPQLASLVSLLQAVSTSII